MSLRKCIVVMVTLGMLAHASDADAQVVTNYYGAVAAPAVAPAVYAAPIQTPVIVGRVPVRTGLFGLRTTYIPVLAPSVIPASGYAVAPYAAARPVVVAQPPVVANYAPSYAANYAPSYAANYAPTPVYQPNAVVQSGFRGAGTFSPYVTPPTAPVTSYYAPPVAPVNPALPFYGIPNGGVPVIPYNAQPGITFSPGSVITIP